MVSIFVDKLLVALAVQKLHNFLAGPHSAVGRHLTRTYVHEVLVNRLGSLNLPRKSMARLTDHPDMTLDF